jgi:hypothetical protein
MKTQATVRLTIFALWVGFWALSSAFVLAAPLFRSQIGQDQVLPAVTAVCSIWLPVLSCFAGFWMSSDERKLSKERACSPHKALAAIVITIAYLGFTAALIFWVTYVIDYTQPEYQSLTELPKGISFQEQLDAAIRLAIWISPVGTAPVVALTGGKSVRIDSKKQPTIGVPAKSRQRKGPV